MSPGVQRRPWEGEPALLTSAGVPDTATWNAKNRFRLPHKVRAPSGCCRVHLWKSRCSTSRHSTDHPATVPRHSLGRDQQPPLLRGTDSRFPELVSPCSTCCKPPGQRHGEHPSQRLSPHAEPLPAANSQRATRCHAASAMRSHSRFLATLLQNATH